MKRLTFPSLTLVLIIFFPACTNSVWKTTGQVEPVMVDEVGHLARAPIDPGKSGLPVAKDAAYSVRVASAYPSVINETGGAEFILYGEIYDLEPQQERLIKIVFKESNQTTEHILNFRDRILFGPIKHTGNPMRIRLFLIELDKDEDESLRMIVREAARVAATFAPQFSPFSGVVTGVGDLFLALDDDERVISHDLTLFPSTHDFGPYIQSGHIALIKTEHPAIFKEEDGNLTKIRPDETGYKSAQYRAKVVRNETGTRVQVADEDYTEIFYYDDGENALAERNGIRPIVTLRIMEGVLWLQVVALENATTGEVLIAYDRVVNGPKKDSNGKTRKRSADEVDEIADNCKLKKDGEQVEVLDPRGGRAKRTWERKTYYVGGRPNVALRDTSGEKSDFVLGSRILYKEKTWAVLTISHGGPAVDRKVLEAISMTDEEVLKKSLRQGSREERLREIISGLADDVVKIKLSEDVTDQVDADFAGHPEERITGAAPVAYLQQLVSIESSDQEHRQDDILRNEAIIEAVRGIVQQFPYNIGDAGTADKIKAMRALKAANFEKRVSPAFPDGNGTFRYSPPAADQ